MISLTLSLIFLVAVLYLLFKKNTHDGHIQYDVRGIAHSISEYGKAVFTVYARYPRFIHAELMTHKDFSRSASSSRAIPVMKMLKQVWHNPAIPVSWGANIPGMQALTQLTGWRANVAKNIWVTAGKIMCVLAYGLMKLGLHKQVANRLLEPWQLIHVVITSSKWVNFDTLRIHPDAQPEIRVLAELIKMARDHMKPTLLKAGEWHLPWIDPEDWDTARHWAEFKNPMSSNYFEIVLDVLRKQSAARCARTSYATFDGKRSTIEADLKLYAQLVESRPVHASPCEHQATPDTQSMYCTYVMDANGHYGRVAEKLEWDNPELHGNLSGWLQFRRMIPEHYIDG